MFRAAFVFYNKVTIALTEYLIELITRVTFVKIGEGSGNLIGSVKLEIPERFRFQK